MKTIALLITVLLIISIFHLNGCVSQQSGQSPPSNIEISEIEVFDSNMQPVKVINQPEQLQVLNKIWKQLKTINKLPNTKWTCNLRMEFNHNNIAPRHVFRGQKYASPSFVILCCRS
jgi:hypothetical protein